MPEPREFCLSCDTYRDNITSGMVVVPKGLLCGACVALACEALALDTGPERSQQRLCLVLDAMALSATPQPYSTVAPLLGFHHRDRSFHVQLGQVMRSDHAANRPLRPSLVISKTRGMPGPGYFQVCRELGFEIQDETEFWQQQIRRLVVWNTMRFGSESAQL